MPHQHSPNTPTTGLRERAHDTSKITSRSGRQNAAPRRNMRREERVTVQGPVKEQQPDGMSHRGSPSPLARRPVPPPHVRSHDGHGHTLTPFPVSSAAALFCRSFRASLPPPPRRFVVSVLLGGGREGCGRRRVAGRWSKAGQGARPLPACHRPGRARFEAVHCTCESSRSYMPLVLHPNATDT